MTPIWLLVLVPCLGLVEVESVLVPQDGPCSIPVIVRGSWFSREYGENVVTDIDADSMTRVGQCAWMRKFREDDIMFIFRERGGSRCHHCVRVYVRTINVLEKRETGCVDVPPEDLARAGGDITKTIDTICRQFDNAQEISTLFSENPTPINCRSSFEGVWHFTYKNQYRFTGECNHPAARLQSCQVPGSQFLIQNQKFNITYRPCSGMKDSLDAVVEYSCLGDWFIGKNHYIAVVNTKESRKDEKYRCMLRNRDDDLFVGATITAECNILKSPETSPERLRLTPIKAEAEVPGCSFPKDFSGEWINTANLDAEVVINDTHITETYYPDEGRYRETIYVCKQQRGSRFMVARMGIDGCQKDYVCFEFLQKHQNVIRYRRGTNMIITDFHTVCSWVQFPGKDHWLYNIWLAKNPVPIKCPVAGKFKFQQIGDVPFRTRILGGVTQSPRPNIYCKENISDFSVCGDQKEIWIDAEYCLSVDYLGRPVDIYSDPDYKLKCIGYWKENLRSYLITYDELDAFSKYRCWVYQRSDINQVLMSEAFGSFCDVRQNVSSYNATEGASVALSMVEYERERDQCPMFFDDGANPWEATEGFVRFFPFGNSASNVRFSGLSVTLCVVLYKVIM